MTKKLLMAVLAANFLANVCPAQSSSSQSVTNWGEPVNGVQLSISLSNNVLPVGTTTTVQCRVKNSSTNTIGWWVAEPTQGFIVSLTNSAGKFYRLTPEPDTNSEFIHTYYSFARKMEAGGAYECSVPIDIGRNIKLGKYQLEVKQCYYQLEAKKYFRVDKKQSGHEFVSNLLEVQIK